MAVKAFQGYEKSLNLGESEDDVRIINNLTSLADLNIGSNIASDLALFINNKRNTGSLTWEYDTNNSSIVTGTSPNYFVFQSDRAFVFTNGDVVTIAGNELGAIDSRYEYYIGNLQTGLGTFRNQVGFSVYSDEALTTPVSLLNITNDVTFTRSYEVTQDNLLFIRTPDINDSNLGGADLGGDQFSFNINGSFNDVFDEIDGNIDTSNFLRSLKYVGDSSIATNRTVNIEGVLTVQDPDASNSNLAALATNLSPGLFITDPFSDVTDIQKTRAFSTDANPWTADTGNNKVVTQSTEVNIGNLAFSDTLKLTSFNGVSNPTPAVITTFTHKVPMTVDGVTYFVLLKA